MAERMSRPRSSGIAAIELLLITPLVFFIAYAMLNFILALSLQGRLQNCAQAGAQWAALSRAQSLDDAGIVAAAEAAAAGSSIPISISVDRYCACLDTATARLTVVDCETGTCSGTESSPQKFIGIQASAPYLFQWQIPGLPLSWALKSRLDLRTF